MGVGARGAGYTEVVRYNRLSRWSVGTLQKSKEPQASAVRPTLASLVKYNTLLRDVDDEKVAETLSDVISVFRRIAVSRCFCKAHARAPDEHDSVIWFHCISKTLQPSNLFGVVIHRTDPPVGFNCALYSEPGGRRHGFESGGQILRAK